MYTAYGKTKSSGFTIVELLIVIVVIAVLAAITVVAYNGIRLRSTVAALTTELNSVSKQIGIGKVDTNTFPANLNSLKKSAAVYFEYTVDNGAGTYCVTGTQSGTSYYIQQSGPPQSGRCPGHTGVASTDPTFQNLTVTQVTSTARNLRGLSSSPNGTHVAYSVESGYVYTTSNGGTTWNERTSIGIDQWRGISISTDGTIVSVIPVNGTLRRSIDSGATWTNFNGASPGSCNWRQMYAAKDGQTIVLLCNGNLTPSTRDGGATWNSTHLNDPYVIAGSYSGNVIVAFDINYAKPTSDKGLTWDGYYMGFPTQQSFVVSGDGTVVYVASASNGAIYRSLNRGQTWSAVTTTNTAILRNLAVSQDGTKMVAGNGVAGQVLTSTDSGATWVVRSGFGSINVTGLTMSADGTIIYAVTGGAFPESPGYVYKAVFD